MTHTTPTLHKVPSGIPVYKVTCECGWESLNFGPSSGDKRALAAWWEHSARENWELVKGLSAQVEEMLIEIQRLEVALGFEPRPQWGTA